MSIQELTLLLPLLVGLKPFLVTRTKAEQPYEFHDQNKHVLELRVQDLRCTHASCHVHFVWLQC